MASVLKSMGMTDAFAPGAADLSGMNGGRDLFISAVVHEAYVEVNEEGTEAAAATGVAISLTSVPIDRPPVFRADHPFLFVIRHKQTGSILFIGRVTNPKT
jgi:serpin B